jgi:putative membrane protein
MPKHPPEFRDNRLLHGLLILIALVWIITAISPYNRFDWFLENILVFVYGAILIATYHRFAFSNTSYILFVIFITLHLVGAHYTYSETPIGYWLKDLFDLQRNHYDRMIHFAYGLLCAYPFRELLIRAAGVQGSGWAYFLPVCIILAFSGFYEMIEMVVARIVSPEAGDAYLGTQGDIWDAQKDMLMGFSGAVLAMTITRWRSTGSV